MLRYPPRYRPMPKSQPCSTLPDTGARKRMIPSMTWTSSLQATATHSFERTNEVQGHPPAHGPICGLEMPSPTIDSIVDWIVSQSWSSGRAGGIGVSYCGTTAQMLAATGHPAVKAVIPKFIELDVYTDIIFPGGILLEPLWKEYVESCRQLDLNRDIDAICGESSDTVKPVDADADGSMLAAAIEEHRTTNPDFLTSTMVTFRDEVIPGIGVTIDDFSVHELRDEIERSGVAIYGWGSWNDACTADTVVPALHQPSLTHSGQLSAHGTTEATRTPTSTDQTTLPPCPATSHNGWRTSASSTIT